MLWCDLMGLAAAIFMIFFPCPPIALTRIDPTEEQTGRDGKSVFIIKTQEKTDLGKGRSIFAVRRSPDFRLSPRFYYDLLKRRATRLGCPHALFCSDRGQAYSRSDSICKALVRLLVRMGVEGYTAYSFRHSMIQALFDSGMDEKKVNAYTGHSQRSSTALDYYYHLDKNWIGMKLCALPTDRIALSEQAQKAIQVDEADNEDEE
jgi:integrase